MYCTNVLESLLYGLFVCGGGGNEVILWYNEIETEIEKNRIRRL